MSGISLTVIFLYIGHGIRVCKSGKKQTVEGIEINPKLVEW